MGFYRRAKSLKVREVHIGSSRLSPSLPPLHVVVRASMAQTPIVMQQRAWHLSLDIKLNKLKPDIKLKPASEGRSTASSLFFPTCRNWTCRIRSCIDFLDRCTLNHPSSHSYRRQVGSTVVVRDATRRDATQRDALSPTILAAFHQSLEQPRWIALHGNNGCDTRSRRS